MRNFARGSRFRDSISSRIADAFDSILRREDVHLLRRVCQQLRAMDAQVGVHPEDRNTLHFETSVAKLGIWGLKRPAGVVVRES